ncbi:MAG: insulinase family protein [Candidatus Atribacteria bacterium]|nr:insulinase family protein [Candidatus Atribacteria bacterium]
MPEVIKRVEKVALKNGLVLLFLPLPESALFSVNLCLNLGNLFEGEKDRGISALMQEVILKGTKKRDATELSQAVERLGAYIHSSSNYFTGRVAIDGPAENHREILKIFFEVIKTPAFRKEEIEKEKKFLISLLHSLDDDPLKAAIFRFRKAFFGRHPYAFPTLGEESTLQNLDEEKIWHWYGRIFVPNNMVIAVVGNFQVETVKKIFEDELGNVIPREKVSPFRESFFPASLKIVDRREVRDAWVVLGFRAPGLLEVEERIAFEVLNNALGGGMYSRLFLKIREERGLSYQVGSFYFPLLGPSFLCAFCSFPFAYFDAVISLLREEFRNLINMEEEEFEEAKNYTRGTFLQHFETVSSLSSLLSFCETVGLGWEFPLRYDQILQSFTLEKARTIYRRFMDQRESMGAIVPVTH